MEAWIWVVIVLGVLAAAVVAAWGYRRRRTHELRARFGPEYDRTLWSADSRREAERELESRRARRERLDIRPLDPATRQRYAEAWEDVQARFVDAPAVALASAEGLALQVMRERGYPTDDFEQQAADVSVDHPEVVSHFRAGHEVMEQAGRGAADTEELRQGLMRYRALFDRLLESEVPAARDR